MYAGHLKEIRQKIGLSAAKMAERLDIPVSTFVSYERGDRTPSAAFLTRLYKIFDVNTNWYVSGEGSIFNNIDNDDALTLKIEKVLKQKGLI